MNKHIKCDDLRQKIFIEDTDFQGVVYHANYLKFFERARSNFLSKVGVSQKVLRNQDKAFVVKSIELDYLNSAGLGTEIIVESYVEKKSKARIVFYQKVLNENDNKILVSGRVEVCFINLSTKKPIKFPDELLSNLT